MINIDKNHYINENEFDKITDTSIMTTLWTGTMDSGVIAIPDIGFDFIYRGANIRDKISVNADCILKLNGEDTGINNADRGMTKVYTYYNEELEYFSFMYVGNYAYSNWNAENICWEVRMYKFGAMELIVDRHDRDSFNVLLFKQNIPVELKKSIILVPLDEKFTTCKYYKGKICESNVRIKTDKDLKIYKNVYKDKESKIKYDIKAPKGIGGFCETIKINDSEELGSGKMFKLPINNSMWKRIDKVDIK